MRPQIAVAKVKMKVAVPMMACIGTRPALNLAVPLSQARRARKLNSPTNSCNVECCYKRCFVSFSVVHLKCEQAHSAKSQPGVDAVEMRNWICSETLVIPDSDEAQSNAGDGKQVKH